MLRFVRYFLFIALFGTAFSLKATHNRAGEITYKWISGYTYSITLTTYTDDGISVADRCKMTLRFGDGDSCIAYRENGVLSASNAECAVSYAGVIIKITPAIKKNVYSCVHTYSGPGSYKIHMFDRNRNNGVVNIPNSVNQPFYIESLLVIGTKPNSSPILSIPPIDEAALGKCFYHNPGAYDADGDSLSYELVMCKGEDALGNIGAIISGYAYPNPGATGSFSIDPYTGTLSWCNPQSPGEYNVAIVIKEWRKPSLAGTYYLVGSVIRDMQIIVSNSLNSPPQFSVLTRTCVQAGSIVNTVINTSDLENNILNITATGSPFALSAANFSSTTSINATGNFSWTTSCSDVRGQNHTAYFKIIDNASPVSLANFLVYDVSVIAPAPQNLTLTPSLNIMKLGWNKPSCHPLTGNKIIGYNFYRIVGTSTWIPASCDRGVPASAGYTYVGSTFSENDTTFVDYSVISLPNNTNCSYAISAFYSDFSESYATPPLSTQLVIGIDEKTKNNYSVSVFPNPSSELFNLKFTAQKQGLFNIELFDVNGRKIKHLNTTFVNGSSDVELNLKEFENGYYILKIESEEKNCTYKPIVKLD